MFRLLVTGSRGFPRRDLVEMALDRCLGKHPEGLQIVHGACPQGPDLWADEWADQRSVPVERWPASWERYGRRAGFMRNAEMVESWPDGVYAFCWRRSSGTTHCATLAEKAGIPVWWCRLD